MNSLASERDRSKTLRAYVERLEHDPEKHALAKARVDTGFRKRLVPANAGIMLHQ